MTNLPTCPGHRLRIGTSQWFRRHEVTKGPEKEALQRARDYGTINDGKGDAHETAQLG
jgi:hypothetical protein